MRNESFDERATRPLVLFGTLLALAGLGGAAYGAVQAPSMPTGGFSSNRAWHLLVEQVNLGPRSPGSPGHSRGQLWLRRELAKVSGKVESDTFWGRRDGVPVQLTNYLARIGPSGPKPILLAAHWDTRPWADRDPDPAKRHLPIIGADDGASGVAVALEVARVIRPQVPVQLVLFDGEDLGRDLDGFFQGSRRFANQIKAGRQERPRWGILVDMVGKKQLSITKEALSAQNAPALTERIWATARLTGSQLEFPEIGGPVIYDDHWPLMLVGVGMVDLVDLSYPQWHTLADQANQCDPVSLGAVGRVVARVIDDEQ